MEDVSLPTLHRLLTQHKHGSHAVKGGVSS
jgi:hypothetical protein